jgi:superfamily I DNA/RNA helicase
VNDLQRLVDRLNPEQRAAVEADGNTVVLAGPGSGKTDTIVLKVAVLMQREVRPPRGVACITYGNDAVREFTIRLRHLGIRSDRRLFLGTVHGFCLNRVLRPYAALVGDPSLARPSVLSPKAQRDAVQAALDAVGVDDDPQYFDGKRSQGFVEPWRSTNPSSRSTSVTSRSRAPTSRPSQRTGGLTSRR